MSRYKNNRFIKNKDGKLHYATTEYVEVPVRNTDLYFIATEGDRCDNLAQRFYGTPNLWWYVAHVNHLTTMNVPVGTNLRIPVSKPTGY